MAVDIEWSNSSLSLLERCGEAFRRRIIERDFIPSGPRALRGTVIHKVAKASFMRKLKHEAVPSIEEARDLAAAEFERTWQAGVLVSDDDVDEAGSVAAVEAKTKDFAVDLSGFHTQKLVPAIEPVAVERKITVKPKDSDLTIHGTIDLIGALPWAGEAIHDLKTSEKSPASGLAEDSQQLTMYGLIRLCEVGALPESFALDYLVRTPSRAEKKHVVLETTRDMEDVAALVRRINTATEAVKRGVFVPTNPENWWCSRSWCEYFDTCPYVRRGTRPRS